MVYPLSVVSLNLIGLNPAENFIHLWAEWASLDVKNFTGTGKECGLVEEIKTPSEKQTSKS